MVNLLIETALLGVGSLLAIAFVVGAIVAVRPEFLDRLRDASDRKYSMRRATRPLDIPRNVDRLFYRHHQLYGAAVVALAIVLLSFIALGDPGGALVSLFDPRYHGVAGMLVEVGVLVLWMLGLFCLLVGIVFMVRPSALKRLELVANRWLTPRRMTRGLEREYSQPGDWARRYPRSWGIAIAVASGTCILALILHAPRILDWAG